MRKDATGETKKRTRVVLANDTGSFPLKEAVKEHLEALEYDVLDLGTGSPNRTMSYVEAGRRVAVAIQEPGEACSDPGLWGVAADGDVVPVRGILFCGSGAGVMLAANKHKGIHAVVCESVETARGARVINDANVLCMGANIVEEALAKKMTEVFLTTAFAEGLANGAVGRVRRFAGEVREIEEENYK